jgi:hypothetical protein
MKLIILNGNGLNLRDCNHCNLAEIFILGNDYNDQLHVLVCPTTGVAQYTDATDPVTMLNAPTRYTTLGFLDFLANLASYDRSYPMTLCGTTWEENLQDRMYYQVLLTRTMSSEILEHLTAMLGFPEDDMKRWVQGHLTFRPSDEK